VAPGEAADIWLNITNTGNTDEAVGLGRFQIPPGWFGWFEGPGRWILGDSHNFSIKARSIAAFHAFIAAPYDALCGDYHFPGIIEDGAGESHPIILSVHVEEVHSLELNCSCPKQAGSPGETVLFPLTVTNLGNGPDSVRVESSDMPAGWHQPYFLFENETEIGWLDLNASQHMGLMACVRVPASTPLDVVNLTVTAISRGGFSASVPLSVLIEKADLVIAHVRFSPPVLHAGKRCSVNVTVANTGNVAAENVTVAFYYGIDFELTESPETVAPNGYSRSNGPPQKGRTYSDSPSTRTGPCTSRTRRTTRRRSFARPSMMPSRSSRRTPGQPSPWRPSSS
jgi:hypothetical protein